MAGLAILAKEAGFTVTGSDANVYPPMSTQLQAAGIAIQEGYDPEVLCPAPDLVIVGNVMSRGRPIVEYLLNHAIPYTSGPAWLAQTILASRWVLAVSGTHGKTTTSSMLAWILEQAGLQPGFLIGGLPIDFGYSARLGHSPFFVIEADEYDTAFFDKRSKFIHYRPRTLIINNIEFDHADIFENVAAIQKQFHQLVRTVPGEGLIIAPQDDTSINEVLAMGCWTPVARVGRDWQAMDPSDDGSTFAVHGQGKVYGSIRWNHTGQHNVANALAAIAAAQHAGVPPTTAIAALNTFRGVKRRLETVGQVNGITVYDDFAHHPTAVATTLAGLRARIGSARLIAVLEPRSNSMRLGVFKEALAPALRLADRVLLYQAADLSWSLQDVADAVGDQARVYTSLEELLATLRSELAVGDHVVMMSNGSFGGLPQRLAQVLQGV